MKFSELTPYLFWAFAGLLSLLVAHKSQIDAWAEANPRLAGAMKLLRALGLDPWMFVQALALLVKGRLPPKLQAAKIVAEESAPPPSMEVRVEVAKQSKRPPPLVVPPNDKDEP